MKREFQIFIILLLLMNSINVYQGYAEGPGEKYHVDYSELSNEILTNTIGILTLNSGIKKGTKLFSYDLENKNFGFKDTIDVYTQSVPISHFGYSKETNYQFNKVGNYRFPILDSLDNYLYIAYNCKKDLKAWINLTDIKNDYYVSLYMFNDILHTRNNYFLDLFFNAYSGETCHRFRF